MIFETGSSSRANFCDPTPVILPRNCVEIEIIQFHLDLLVVSRSKIIFLFSYIRIRICIILIKICFISFSIISSIAMSRRWGHFRTEWFMITTSRVVTIIVVVETLIRVSNFICMYFIQYEWGTCRIHDIR
jgi:hypothetical protein